MRTAIVVWRETALTRPLARRVLRTASTTWSVMSRNSIGAFVSKVKRRRFTALLDEGAGLNSCMLPEVSAARSGGFSRATSSGRTGQTPFGECRFDHAIDYQWRYVEALIDPQRGVCDVFGWLGERRLQVACG